MYYYHLAAIGNRLFIRMSVAHYERPELTVTWHEVVNHSLDCWEDFIGHELVAYGDTYVLQFSDKVKPFSYVRQAVFTISWPAKYVATMPLPCPRIRKGTRVRYCSGSWEKYTKRDGWRDMPHRSACNALPSSMDLPLDCMELVQVAS